MKLSTKGRYSVRLMIDLAIHGGQGAVLLKDVSRRQDISEKYFGHFVPLLKSAGLINTTRGSRGGFSLARPASEITLKDIIVAAEGAIDLVGCVDNASQCRRSSGCAARDIWLEATRKIEKIFEGYTLAEAVERQKAKTEKKNHVIYPAFGV
ncbi:MAG: Rrf2 family transcriptional regulator [Candidatus Omnitrophica bacterium]|nr:Rrf2 family transcriptional regulator [Candidatus Omnitrophota bacterium]